jgi:Domain of unknown function (DUF4440)
MAATAEAMSSIETWEQDVRALEEAGRVAFLAGDAETLAGMWDDALLVNSPLNIINDKACVLDLLRSGRIRHTFDDVVIEQVERYDNVVVVMGRDTVDGPPLGEIVQRRFTNIWQLQDAGWKMIARHAQIIAAKPKISA